MIISLLAFILGRFVIHQPLIIVLGLLDAEIAGHGVHGDERLIQPFIQVSQDFKQVEYWLRLSRPSELASVFGLRNISRRALFS